MEKNETMTPAQLARKKWNEANMNVKYDHIHLVLKKGMKQEIQDTAKAKGMSANGFICDTLKKAMEE